MAWYKVVDFISRNRDNVHRIDARKWEEILAGAFELAGFEEVVLTPRSRDFGRDVIAVRRGVGAIKIIGEMKAIGPGRVVDYVDVRSLLGVLAGELDASKAIIATTGRFPSLINKDKIISKCIPTRLELLGCDELVGWLIKLKETK